MHWGILWEQEFQGSQRITRLALRGRIKSGRVKRRDLISRVFCREAKTNALVLDPGGDTERKVAPQCMAVNRDGRLLPYSLVTQNHLSIAGFT